MTNLHDSIDLRITRHAALGLGFCLMLASGAYAQVVPGPADIGHIKPEEKLPVIDHSQDSQVTIPSIAPTVPIPKEAKGIHFTLQAVRIDGATAFTPDQLRDIYGPYLGKDITLDIAYKIAGQLSERYRNAGYFLSRAYIPEQSFEPGNAMVTIRVVEGFVGKVEVPDDARGHSVVQAYIDRLLAQRPLKMESLESFLLRLNDLPGYAFRGVISPLKGEDEGAVKLTLVPTTKEGKGTIQFDNASSRFLGPNEMSISYATSLLPLQQTSMSGLTSVAVNRLHYGTLDHAIVIAPDIKLDLTANATEATPGYTLSKFDIQSNSTFLALNLDYQWIRQRQENLALKFTLDGRNVESDILAVPLTRDYVRAARVNATYDLADAWRGANSASVTLSHGLDLFGSSKQGDINLSRAQARPDFTKGELSLTRLQGITNDWSLQMAGSGQMASGVLYSSEEFGYGGQTFGRAYDASEITGDQGVSGSLELRYGGLAGWQPISLQPYAFYDIGVVWNDAIAQPKRESGASAGFGIRGTTVAGISGDIGVAWPLTRPIATPIYGGDKEGPRIMVQLSKAF